MSAPAFPTPPTVEIPPGEVFYRVHGESRHARWYGRKDATSRWDDPDGKFGVLYLGRSPVGAFAETLLRSPSDRDVLWSHVRQKRQARFGLVQPLRVAKLHGEGLAWFGVTASEIARTDYALTQKIAAQIHDGVAPEVDGIQYRSRFDNDELCIAMFDRADAKIELISDDEPIDEGWATAILASRGYRLVDL